MLDRKKIIDSLAERLKIDLTTAEHEYQAIVDHLQDELKANGMAGLPGLGDFVMFDGKLSFVPDTLLVRSINFRYHGLDEWELATIKTPTLLEEDSYSEHESEPAVYIVEEQANDHEPTHKEDQKEQVVHEVIPAQIAIDSNSRTKPIKIRVTKKYMDRGLGLKRAFATFLILATLLAGSSIAWYNDWLAGYGVPSFFDVFPEYATKGDPQSITLNTPSIQVPTPKPEYIDNNPDSTSSISPIEEGVHPELPEPTSPMSTPGLVGAFEDFRRPYYTIIAGTFFSEEGATKALSMAQNAGLRSRMRTISINGDRAWEIHIGQFTSREEALESNKTLPGSFQSNIVRGYGLQ